MAMMAKLSAKTAIVTGAGRYLGMGRAIALELARLGNNVVVADLPQPDPDQTWSESEIWKGLQKVAEEITSFGVQALPVRVDVSDPQAVQAMVETALAAFGRVDILVNNAGIIGANIPLVDYDLTSWHKILEVNLTGTFLCCQAVLKPMLAAGRGGRIINIASVAGKAAYPGMGPYSASKAGVISLTQTLALELAEKGITVNAICPGIIDTDMQRAIHRDIASMQGVPLEQIRKMFDEQPPIKRPGTAQDVAPLVGFLASDAAAYITGQAFNVCGGLEFH
jgi:NAD(P)-dependent dehydrogenase (short-subunit alcohol dehydrogenase family)